MPPGSPPPTTLDPDETNVQTRLPANVREFRHGFWRARRANTFAALLSLHENTNRADRFENCGSGAWVMRCKQDPTKLRVHSRTCHDRWCEACARERRLIVSRNIETFAHRRTLRFFTFTLKHRREPLRTTVNRLYDNFKKWRNCRRIGPKFTGGVFFLEITWNNNTQLWHPHLHVLAEGRYIPHEIARAEWLRITTDSHVVNIQKVNDGKHAAHYVTKYSSKGISPNIWRHVTILAEAMDALRGTRIFNTFGTWRGIRLSADPKDTYDWEPLCSLQTLLARAAAGDDSARRMLHSLQEAPGVDRQVNGLPPPTPETQP